MTILWQLSADVNMLAGQPVTGYARVEAVGVNELGATVVIPAIRDTESNFIFSGPQRIKLIDGRLLTTLEDPVMLPDSTGQSGFSPSSWSYRVTLLLDHLQPSQYPVYVFALGSDLDLADVVSVPAITSPLDTPWEDARAAAEASAAEAQGFRDDLVDMLDDTAGRRDGNDMDVTSRDFHPPTRPRSQRFDGTSHPLSEYFATLADAQTLYPFATTLTDETDWAALQLAVLSVVSYPRAWGAEANDWRQYGTAALRGPAGGYAVVNRPIRKEANTNQNLLITSPAPWSFRIQYTGVDGGRLFELERDSVGTVLVVENVVLQGGGIRVRAPYRGPIYIGDGCNVIDTPHPAVQFEDSPEAGGIGVVGPIVAGLYTNGCAGSVHALSSTATITVVQDFRFINNRDVPLKISGNTDVLALRGDLTGIDAVSGAAGKPFVQITANTGATSNIDLRDIRMGSEQYTMTGPGPGGTTITRDYVVPRDTLVIGELSGTSSAVAIVRLRKVAFRTPPVVSSSVGRAAVRLNAKATFDIDECDFGQYAECLVDEAPYLASETLWTVATTMQSKWGDRNTIDGGHAGPIFSNGGVTVQTPSRLPTHVDARAGADVGDSANLVSADLSTWTATSCSVGAPVTGGPDGTFYYPVTKTAAGMLLSTTVILTAGRRYVFGVRVRRDAGSAIRTARLRVNRGATIMVDQQKLRLDSEWVTFMFRVPYVATTGAATVAIWLDNAEEAANGQTVGVVLPFVNDGWTPKPPRTTVRLTSRKNGPTAPVAGTMYGADGVTWDPLSRGAALPYVVLWNGSAWQAVSNAEPGGSGSAFQSNNATTTASPASSSTETTLVTHTNIPAASLHVGDRVKVHAQGTLDSQVTPGTFNLRFKVNGTAQQVVALVTPAATAGATGAPWELTFDLLVTAVGAAGAFRILGTQVRASGNTNVRTVDNVSTDVTGVDLTGGLQVSITGQTATSSAANTIRHHGSTVEKL